MGLAVVGWPTTANGAPFELAWSAPEGCPTREEIVDATYARLGEARDERPPELFVQGSVTAADEGFVITLALEDAARRRSVGERIVRVDRHDCAEIATPATVVLAMMIAVARLHDAEPSDSVTLEERAPRAPGSSVPPTPAPRSPAARPPEHTTPERPSPDRWSVGAAGVASTGLLPNLGFGAGIHASYWPRSLLLFRVEASFEDGGSVRVAGGHVGFQLIGGTVRAGLPVVRTKAFELIPMLGGRAGVIQHSAEGYATAQNGSRLVSSVGPGVLARVNLGTSIVLESVLDAELNLRRDRFHVVERDERYFVHEPGLVATRFALGLAYQVR